MREELGVLLAMMALNIDMIEQGLSCSCRLKGNEDYILPPAGKRLCDAWRFVGVFALHMSPPYVRKHVKANLSLWQSHEVDVTYGWPQYLDDVGKPAPDYCWEGLHMRHVFFSIGVKWGKTKGHPCRRRSADRPDLPNRYWGPWRNPDACGRFGDIICF